MTATDPPDFLQQVQEMMSAMQEAQSELEEVEVVGSAGGGAVRVTASAAPEILSVEVSAEAVEDLELLGDLIVVAVNDALQRAADAARERLGGLAGFDLPGGLPGLEPPTDGT